MESAFTWEAMAMISFTYWEATASGFCSSLFSTAERMTRHSSTFFSAVSTSLALLMAFFVALKVMKSACNERIFMVGLKLGLLGGILKSCWSAGAVTVTSRKNPCMGREDTF